MERQEPNGKNEYRIEIYVTGAKQAAAVSDWIGDAVLNSSPGDVAHLADFVGNVDRCDWLDVAVSRFRVWIAGHRGLARFLHLSEGDGWEAHNDKAAGQSQRM